MMTFTEYAKRLCELSAKVVETYEEEAVSRDVLELEYRQLMKALQENYEKCKELHARKEQERSGLRAEVERLKADFCGKEVANG